MAVQKTTENFENCSRIEIFTSIAVNQPVPEGEKEGIESDVLYKHMGTQTKLPKFLEENQSVEMFHTVSLDCPVWLVGKEKEEFNKAAVDAQWEIFRSWGRNNDIPKAGDSCPTFASWGGVIHPTLGHFYFRAFSIAIPIP